MYLFYYCQLVKHCKHLKLCFLLKLCKLLKYKLIEIGSIYFMLDYTYLKLYFGFIC